MDAKKRIMATLAGFVVFFFMGFLLYGMLLMDFFMANSGSATGVARSDSDMQWLYLALGNLFYAYLLVYIFDKWTTINTFMGGLKAGAMIGLIVGVAVDFTMYGTTNISNLTATLVDPLVLAVMMGASGGVIGIVLGRK